MAKILIADDSKLVRETMKKMLLELGHEVIGLAEDGEEAYEKYKEFQPDIITLDINMPKLSGMGSLKKIIKDFPDAIAIMVSSEGKDNRNLVYDCIGEGAASFIDKPIVKEDLEKKIEKSLKYL